MPARQCGPNQALFQIAADGTTACRTLHGGQRACPDGQVATGISADGALTCQADRTGLGSLPPRECGAGQALFGSMRMGPQPSHPPFGPAGLSGRASRDGHWCKWRTILRCGPPRVDPSARENVCRGSGALPYHGQRHNGVSYTTCWPTSLRRGPICHRCECRWHAHLRRRPARTHSTTGPYMWCRTSALSNSGGWNHGV